MTEEYEELRIKVKPKIFVVLKELADVAKIFANFQKKHEAGGKKVFTNTLQYYLNALKFDVKKVMGGLDKEVEFMKSEIEKINQLKLAQIKNVQECLKEFANRLIDQPLKFKELSQFLSLPENQYQLMKEQVTELQALKQFQDKQISLQVALAINSLRKTDIFGDTNKPVHFEWPKANDLL